MKFCSRSIRVSASARGRAGKSTETSALSTEVRQRIFAPLKRLNSAITCLRGTAVTRAASVSLWRVNVPGKAFTPEIGASAAYPGVLLRTTLASSPPNHKRKVIEGRLTTRWNCCIGLAPLCRLGQPPLFCLLAVRACDPSEGTKPSLGAAPAEGVAAGGEVAKNRGAAGETDRSIFAPAKVPHNRTLPLLIR